jgi:uncharacterized repeat protein (TIGR01451 family)
MTLRTSATRPRQQWLALVVGLLALTAGAATVVLALISDSGTHDITRPDSGTSETADLGNATVEYIGSSASNQASGTGLFDPFLRLQGSPTEKGFNTCSQSSCGGDVTQFETKTGSWTKAILASAIPVVDCGGDLAGTSCWELFVDINDGNNAKRISLNEVEVWLTTNARLTGYVDPTGFPAGTATQVYDFSGAILINDVNQGSGRGDLRYLIPVQPFAAGDFFVLYSKWGTTSGTAGEFGTGGYASEGGFEEWKVRKAPNLTIVKTADAATVNAGQNIGFTITITNSGAADATGVTINDPLPLGPGLDWSEAPDNPNCSISGVAPAQETLNCGPVTLAAGGGSLSVHVQSPTTAASCGTYPNTATFTSTNAGSGSDDATVTVNCGALQILKNSVKGGAVANAGAVFSVDGPDANTDPDFTVTDDTSAAAPDEAAAVGVVCVTGLAPGTYTVTETTAPSGYAVDTGPETATVVSGSTCASPGTGTVTFVDPPLYDIQVNFRDGGSGETSPTSISCTGTNGTGSTTAATGWDDSLTFEDEPLTANPETIVCTIVVDP